MTSTADLAVVIPTHGRWDVLTETLGALAPQAGDADVVVVVDGEDLRPPKLPVGRTITVPAGGPGAARNAGVAATDRPLLLFLGDDMVPTPGLVDAHLARHRAEPADEVAVVGHVDWHPAVADNRVLRWLEWSCTQFDYVALRIQAGASDEPVDAGFSRLYACNLSLKRSLFEAAGGFDPDFAFYYEEYELGWRLQAHGLVLRYAAEAVVHHRHDYELRDVARRFEGIAVGERQMAAKHPDFEPFLRRRVLSVAHRPPVSRLWTRLADHVPPTPHPVGDRVRNRANAWYLQHLGPSFLEAWYRDAELDELREYLGDDFDDDAMAGHVARVEEEERAAPDDATFYRTSRAYLYDLTAFAMSGTKSPYLRDLRRLVPPGASLLDFGCGIGSDGLRLLDEGYRVSFADYDNPSTRYLRWRLDRRGYEAPVHDIEGEVPGGFDLVYCFDVIEHVDDPVALLEQLEAHAGIVLVNLLEPVAGDTHLHRPLDIDALVQRAVGRGLLLERRYHGRSHLVAYRGTGAASAVQRATGRLRHALASTRR